MRDALMEQAEKLVDAAWDAIEEDDTVLASASAHEALSLNPAALDAWVVLAHLTETPSVRIALLRAFVRSRFGERVGEMLRHPQVLFGDRIEPVAEPSAVGDVADVPTPDGRIGDIGSPPR